MALSGSSLAGKIKANIEAISDFPFEGENPLIVDIRFINAVANAIVEEIVQNADVIPAAHSGTSLNNPAGQPSTGADPQGGVVNSTTISPQTIEGMGSIQ